MSDVLTRICDDKLRHVAARKTARPLDELAEEAAKAPPPRGFARSLEAARRDGRPALIAEIKRASPSKGLIREDFDPASLARAYARGGATCLSVLTDAPYFQGRDEDLGAARAAVPLPALRKDFMLDPYQIAESRALGADCVLLVMAALDDDMAAELERSACEFGMDVLVEVHDEAELARALRLEAHLIGVNNRDLKTLEVDLATTERLAPLVPETHVLVCESGLHTRDDLARMRAAGAAAFLVGESLMRQADVEAATRNLLALSAAAIERA